MVELSGKADILKFQPGHDAIATKGTGHDTILELELLLVHVRVSVDLENHLTYEAKQRLLPMNLFRILARICRCHHDVSPLDVHSGIRPCGRRL